MKFPNEPSRIPEFPEELRKKFDLPEHQHRLIVLANNWKQYDEFKAEHELDLWMIVYVPHDVGMMIEFFKAKSRGLKVIALNDWWLACSVEFEFIFDRIQQERELIIINENSL